MTRPSLMPANTPDFMAPAWASCIDWAFLHPEIMAAFRAETGNRWNPARNRMDAMIDEATGAGDAFVRAFISWANVNVWGPMDGSSGVSGG